MKKLLLVASFAAITTQVFADATGACYKNCLGDLWPKYLTHARVYIPWGTSYEENHHSCNVNISSTEEKYDVCGDAGGHTLAYAHAATGPSYYFTAPHGVIKSEYQAKRDPQCGNWVPGMDTKYVVPLADAAPLYSTDDPGDGVVYYNNNSVAVGDITYNDESHTITVNNFSSELNVFAPNMADEYSVVMITAYNHNDPGVPFDGYETLPIVWQAKAFVYNGAIVYQGNFTEGDFTPQSVSEGVLFTVEGINKTITIPEDVSLDNVVVEVAVDCGSIAMGVPSKYTIDFGAPAARKVTKQVKQNSKVTMSVYPNPVTDNISVDFQSKENGNYEMFITTLDGRKLKSLEKGTLSANQPVSKKYDIAFLPNEVYMLQLVTEKGEKFSKKIIKQ